MEITLYHNPNCGTSRTTLSLLRDRGLSPTVIEYLKHPPSREQLKTIIQDIGVPIREFMRQRGSPYAELQLDNPRHSDEQLIDFILAHPILFNRPVVVTPLGTRLCRPADVVLEILPQP
jgi:arsenate reductase